MGHQMQNGQLGASPDWWSSTTTQDLTGENGVRGTSMAALATSDHHEEDAHSGSLDWKGTEKTWYLRKNHEVEYKSNPKSGAHKLAERTVSRVIVFRGPRPWFSTTGPVLIRLPRFKSGAHYLIPAWIFLNQENQMRTGAHVLTVPQVGTWCESIMPTR